MNSEKELKSGQIYQTTTGWFLMIVEVDNPNNFRGLHIADRWMGQGDYGFIIPNKDMSHYLKNSKLVGFIDATKLEKVLINECS